MTNQKYHWPVKDHSSVKYHITRFFSCILRKILSSLFSLCLAMKVLVILSLLMVTLLARSTKHYLIELEDKNETFNEKEKDHNDEGNVDDHAEKNNDEGINVKPRKV